MLKLDLQFFGGRGASSGGGGGGSTGELVLPDGSKIEFEGDLKYGGDDPNVSGQTRQAITSWETKRGKAKIEYAYAVDADGNPVGAEVRGGKGSVRVPVSFHDTQDATFTHIHPRGDGMLGGTFSGKDLSNFSKYANKTVRAKAKEGTYSISKKKGFDKAGFQSYVSSSTAKRRADYSAKTKSLMSDYRSGKITYDAYLKGNAKAFNTYLVNQHNDLLAGQKKYGYTYTLERS